MMGKRNGSQILKLGVFLNMVVTLVLLKVVKTEAGYDGDVTKTVAVYYVMLLATVITGRGRPGMARMTPRSKGVRARRGT